MSRLTGVCWILPVLGGLTLAACSLPPPPPERVATVQATPAPRVYVESYRINGATTPPPSLRKGSLHGPRIYLGRNLAAPHRARSAPLPPAEADSARINFDHAEISEVARVILGDLMRAPYTVNPTVQGEVTLSTPRPVSKTELVSLFESVLRPFNAVIVYAGGIYSITPMEGARGPADFVDLPG